VAEQVLESRFLPGEGTVLGGSTAIPISMPGGQPEHGHDSLPLLAAALKDPVEGRRVAAARALASHGEGAALFVSDLTGALDDRSRVVRAAAAWALGDVGPAAAHATPNLRRLLRTPSFVRADGLRPRRAGAAAKDAALELTERLDDPDDRVRWQAGEALARLGVDANSVGPLVRLVRYRRTRPRPGRWALGRVGPRPEQLCRT
jgi:HEAT repeat protein